MQFKKSLLVAIGVATLVIAGLVGIRAFSEGELKELPAAAPVSLDIRTEAEGMALRPGTQGISLETRDILRENFDKANLATLLRNLGPATLRIGGNNSDEVFWTATNEPKPSWASAVVQPADIDRLAKVARDSGWNVTYTVNLERFDPQRAADNAAYVSRALGPALQAIEIGNEPDSYYTDANRYLADYDTYVKAIRQRVPDVRFIGNDSAKATGPFQDAYVEHVRTSASVSALAQHGYPQTACDGNPTIASLLSLKTYESEKGVFSAINANATRAGVPGMINETNSVACEGKKGVSDTYASAVWAVSHTLAGASAGMAQVNYHGSTAECGVLTPAYKHYTPFCATGDNGKLREQPIYYGMLLARQMGSGTFVGVDNPAVARVHAFAVQDGGTLRVALANVEDPLETGPIEVTLRLDKRFGRASLIKLATTSPDGLAATGSISVGDAALEADGKVWGPKRIPVPVGKGEVKVRLSAGSASVLTLSP